MNSFYRMQHVAEETQPIVYTPIFIGNECIIAASQNQRCLNDDTILNFNRLMPNGELIPMEYFTNDPAFYEHALNELRARRNQASDSMLSTPTTSLPELRTRLMQAQAQAQQQHLMHMGNYACKEQMQQYSDVDMREPQKFCYHVTKSTSTTELTTQNIKNSLCRNCGTKKGLKRPIPLCFSRGCNTEDNESSITLANHEIRVKKPDVFEQRRLRRNFQNII